MMDPAAFLHRLFSALRDDGVDVSAMELDHLCYRVADLGRYEELNALLATEGVLLGEHTIGGRPIATYRLRTPFAFEGRSIAVVELPAPKAGSPYAEGYEHAEFVVLEDLRAFAQRHPHLHWDLSDLHKPGNPDVRLRYNGFSAKFHRRALAEVIARERTGVGPLPPPGRGLPTRD